MIKRLPENCTLLYSDLLQKVESSQCVPIGGGSFTSKTIKGATYWYFQTKSNGETIQKYLGRESDALLQSIELSKGQSEWFKRILDERKRLIAMISAGGGSMEKGRPAKILTRLADAGLFTSGGVLVGSFAFSCYGNMLGVSTGNELSRTSDMDFSVEKNLEIGIQRSMIREVEEIGGFKQSPSFSPSIKSFDLIADDGFKVEFLTTKENAQEKTPVLIERFMLHAQPLEFMDYLIEETDKAVVLHGAGIPVVIPSPARFALHKLAVSQLRPARHQAKSVKDISQASAIIEVLLEDNPGSLLIAADALRDRGDFLSNHVLAGMKKLPEQIGVEVGKLTSISPVQWDSQLGRVKKVHAPGFRAQVYSGQVDGLATYQNRLNTEDQLLDSLKNENSKDAVEADVSDSAPKP